MSQQVKTRLRDADPRGRVDVALYRLGEKIADHVGQRELWNSGLGEVAEAVIENIIPAHIITPADLVKSLGLGRKR